MSRSPSDDIDAVGAGSPARDTELIREIEREENGKRVCHGRGRGDVIHMLLQQPS